MHVLGEEKLLQMLSDPSGRRKIRDAILAGMMPEERFGTTMFGASVKKVTHDCKSLMRTLLERGIPADVPLYRKCASFSRIT